MHFANRAGKGLQNARHDLQRCGKVLAVDSDAVLLAAAPERGLVDAEDVGRLLQGAGVGQDAPDVLLLDPVQADGIAQPDRPVGNAQVVRQVMHVDPVPPAEDDGPFDDVSQFADVSRPAVIPQEPERLVGEAGHRPVAAPAEEDQRGAPQGRPDPPAAPAAGEASIWITLSR